MKRNEIVVKRTIKRIKKHRHTIAFNLDFRVLEPVIEEYAYIKGFNLNQALLEIVAAGIKVVMKKEGRA